MVYSFLTRGVKAECNVKTRAQFIICIIFNPHLPEQIGHSIHLVRKISYGELIIEKSNASVLGK